MPTALSLLAVHAAGLAVYVAWVLAHTAARGTPAWPWLVAIPFLYAALVLAVTLADFALAWWWRTPRPPAARIGAAATVRMVWQEFRAMLPSAWRMLRDPFTAHAPAAAPDVLPVVLVHGVLCNAGVWSSQVAVLRARGVTAVYRLSYGPPLASIDRFAEQLAALIERARAATGAARVLVVAHSMGGLVTRAYVARHGGAALAGVITLGTPWRGSRFAGLVPGTSLAQIRPGSAWLAALPAGVDAQPPFTALWSWHDSMVAPQSSCALEGATNVPLTGRGHNALLHDPDVVSRVAGLVVQARAAEAARHRHGQAG